MPSFSNRLAARATTSSEPIWRSVMKTRISPDVLLSASLNSANDFRVVQLFEKMLGIHFGITSCRLPLRPRSFHHRR